MTLMIPISGKSWSSVAKSSVFRTGQRARRLGRASGSELKKKGRSVGSDRSLGWKGKPTGWPRSAASGGAEGAVCRLGREARKGLAGSQVRFAQLGPKALKGQVGALDGHFASTAHRAERLARGSATSKMAKMATNVGLALLAVGLSLLPKVCCQS